MKKSRPVLRILLIFLLVASFYFLVRLNSSLSNNQDENTSFESKELEENDNMINQDQIEVNITVNDKTFSGVLYNSDTVQELITHFPITLNMAEMNSNEKYNYLDFVVPTASYVPTQIYRGDIKLYGNNCLVIFYDNFQSSYAYTDLGKITNAEDFIKELGAGTVTVTFELA